MQIGKIDSIWRYPVKGMCGEEIPHTYTAFTGLMGDRIHGVTYDDIEDPAFIADLEKLTGRSLRIHTTQRGQFDARPW